MKITSQGGFINPTASLAALPTVDVLSDGHIFTPGASVDGTDPLVQPVNVRDVGADGAAQILAAIKTAGLDKEVDGGGVVADTGTTIFTVVIDGQKVVNRFANQTGGPGHPSPTGNDVAGTPFDLLSRLTDPSETWGASSAAATTFVPAGYRVYAAPAAGAGSASVAWPLSTPLDTFGTAATGDFGVDNLRTGVVIGADAQALATALADAAAGTTLTSGGKSYQVWIRALLPDEIS